MNKIIKIFAIVLTLIMIVPTVMACVIVETDSENDNNDKNDSVVTTEPQGGLIEEDALKTTDKKHYETYTPPKVEFTPAYTTAAAPPSTDAPTEPPAKDPYESTLPEHDWEKKSFLILGRDGGYYSYLSNFEISRGSLPSDSVGKAIWDRNKQLEQKYNFTISYELSEKVKEDALTGYDSQDSVFDLVIYTPMDAMSHATYGYLSDLYSLDYINFEHAAWNKDINEELTFNGKLYFTTSQFLLQDKGMTYVLFYNKKLAGEGGNSDFEKYVENNTWDLVKFEEECRRFSYDLDGKGPGGQFDSFGVAAESNATFAASLYGAGFRLGNNGKNSITLVEASKDIQGIVDNVAKVWFDRNVLCTPEYLNVDSDESVMDIFLDSRALFYCSFPLALNDHFDEKCSFDLGVMPFAKNNASQSRYYNLTQRNSSSVFAIPVLAEDPERAAFFLQAISEGSCKTSYDSYVKSIATRQDSNNAPAEKMLDLCFNSITYDPVAILDCGALYTTISYDMPANNTKNFTQLYSSWKPMAESILNEYNRYFSNLS